MSETRPLLSDIALSIVSPLIGEDRIAEPQDLLCAHGLVMYGPGKMDCHECDRVCGDGVTE